MTSERADAEHPALRLIDRQVGTIQLIKNIDRDLAMACVTTDVCPIFAATDAALRGFHVQAAPA